ncbi:MAG: recombinase family protein [Roseburia sp.]
MGERHIYHTAVYLRLSRDDTDIDGGKKTESNSIGNQRQLLRTYLQSHEELQLFDIYMDDGYSGANFDRPEFQRMMGDIQAGKVNCVLVKDLSRFGRDYIETGRLIQKTFPAFSVRFIAVTDHYDSLYADRVESSLVLPVKNFVNDSYCRDISIKVKAQQKVKRMEGKYIAAFAVYGYQKDAEDKNKLIPDPYAADVVRRIFSWKIAGMSLGAIADKLNENGILSPLEYKKLIGMKYQTGFSGNVSAKWASASVKRILTNAVYMGDMVQGKREKINYKMKKRMQKQESEWICVKNTHEAIVPEAKFLAAQELLRYDGRVSRNSDTANLFSGILLCADCRAPMIRRVNLYKGQKTVYYICQTKNKSQGCSRHSIREELLKRILFGEIKKYMELMVSYADAAFYLDGVEVNDAPIAEYDKQIAALGEEYDRFDRRKRSLFCDLKEGLIDQDEFVEFSDLYEKRCGELARVIEAQKQMIRDMYQNAAMAKARITEIKETLEPPELCRELLVTTVRRIYLHENRRMEILFRFSDEDEMEKLASMRRGDRGESAGWEVE